MTVGLFSWWNDNQLKASHQSAWARLASLFSVVNADCRVLLSLFPSSLLTLWDQWHGGGRTGVGQAGLHKGFCCSSSEFSVQCGHVLILITWMNQKPSLITKFLQKSIRKEEKAPTFQSPSFLNTKLVSQSMSNPK